MTKFIVRRFLLMIPTLILVSFVSFVVIQAPPGDYVSSYVATLKERGEVVDMETVAALRSRYGVDQPFLVQYFKWIRNLLRGDLGSSMQWNEPVKKIVLERLPYSLLISLSSLVVVYVLGVLIGMYSATHQYSLADYSFTFIGFIGLAIPEFLFALILLWVIFVNTGEAAIGLFSAEYRTAPWSLAKIVDLLKHLWVPAIIVGTAGTAGLIRTMRANLLDELPKPYVMVAWAKGLPRHKVLYKYPFRIAINPVISTIGWMLPELITGEVLVSLVMGIPTLAPMFLQALLMQDMYLAGSIVFILAVVTVVGTLLSDVLLAWLDPRIREAI